MVWRQVSAVAAGVLFGMGMAGAMAQQPTSEQANAIRQSCRSDYEAHCASVPPGGSAALQCLKSNIASLSPGCQTAVGAVGGNTAAQGAPAPQQPPRPPMTTREEMAMMRNACGTDYRRWCGGVRLGGGRAVACLADHNESLSPPCREALAGARGAR